PFCGKNDPVIVDFGDSETQMIEPAQRVAIVGGGAAGALVAIHLLCEHRERGALEIDLIDRDGSFGAGVAYGTEDPLHLLNVPAVRMGGIAGHPEHFHDWLAERGEEVAEEAYLPRGLYATYLRDLLARGEREAIDARLRRVHGDVTGIAVRAGAADPVLELNRADGERIEADRVVLALGPLQAGDPIPVPAELKESGVWISDPWAAGALDEARRSRSVLIVGSGLSMVDVALSLGEAERGPRGRAVSRPGLLPRPPRPPRPQSVSRKRSAEPAGERVEGRVAKTLLYVLDVWIERDASQIGMHR